MKPGPSGIPAGTRLAPEFVAVAHLHRGALFDIYDLWSEGRACRCIGKLVRPDGEDCRDAEQRLIREGELLARLTHPHLVRAYEVLTAPQPIVILETLPGETLAHILEQRGPLPAADAAYLGLHLCSALSYLHRHATLHLDLTPANVVASRGLATIIDLSLAQAPGPSRGGLGTPGYAAPELVHGEMLSPATDVWGVAALLVAAVAGDAPCAAKDAAAASDSSSGAHLGRLLSDELPVAIQTPIVACLDPEPTRRPNLVDLAMALSRIVALEGDALTRDLMGFPMI